MCLLISHSQHEEIRAKCEKMLGFHLVTKQTPPCGVMVHKVTSLRTYPLHILGDVGWSSTNSTWNLFCRANGPFNRRSCHDWKQWGRCRHWKRLWTSPGKDIQSRKSWLYILTRTSSRKPLIFSMVLQMIKCQLWPFEWDSVKVSLVPWSIKCNVSTTCLRVSMLLKLKSILWLKLMMEKVRDFVPLSPWSFSCRNWRKNQLRW